MKSLIDLSQSSISRPKTMATALTDSYGCCCFQGYKRVSVCVYVGGGVCVRMSKAEDLITTASSPKPGTTKLLL